VWSAGSVTPARGRFVVWDYHHIRGTWDEGPFDNDTAADWVFEFEEADQQAGLDHIQAALVLAAGVGGNDYLKADAGMEAVAAAEVVAAIRGLAVERSAYNEEALDWVARTTPVADQPLVNLAVTALDRVAASKSEPAKPWEGSGVSVVASLGRITEGEPRRVARPAATSRSRSAGPPLA